MIASQPRSSLSSRPLGLGLADSDPYVTIPRTCTPPSIEASSSTANTSPSVYSNDSPRRSTGHAEADERALADRIRIRAQQSASRWARVFSVEPNDNASFEDGTLGSPFTLSEATFVAHSPRDGDTEAEIDERTPPAQWAQEFRVDDG
jgi:hypothetical protein